MRPFSVTFPLSRFRNTEKGFSLLEVIVALAILSLSLGVIFQIYGNGAYQMRASQEYAEAVSIAQSLLAEATATATPATNSETYRFGEYLCTIHRHPFSQRDAFEVAKNNISLGWERWQIDVTISWRSSWKDRDFTLTTMQLFPAL